MDYLSSWSLTMAHKLRLRSLLVSVGQTGLNTFVCPPSSNRVAERFVQTLLRKSEKNGLSFPHRLSSFLLMYRTTPQGTTSLPPAVLLTGRPLCTWFDLLHLDSGCTVTSQQSVHKQHHDNHSKPRSMQVGQLVMVQDFRGSSRWVPASVVTQLGPSLSWSRHQQDCCGNDTLTTPMPMGRTLHRRLNQPSRRSFPVLPSNQPLILPTLLL